MPSVLISAFGTNIGNMTGSGGLAAAFDGVTNVGFVDTATRGDSVGWVGKTLARSDRFLRAVVYGSNDIGYAGGSGEPQITINIKGKQGAIGSPPSGGGWTTIGTITFTDTANESTGRTITSTDTTTFWDHIIAEITRGDGSSGVRCAELELWVAREGAHAIFIS